MSKNIKNILVIILIISISSGISVMANTLIDSKEVIYDNKKSGMESTNVQAAVDELYSAATDYSALNNKIDSMQQTIIDKIYPVGSVYISTTDSTIEKVSERFGGTWEKYAEGRTLIGEGTGTDTNGTVRVFNVNNSSGEYTRTLTINEMPSHSHTNEVYSSAAAISVNDQKNLWITGGSSIATTYGKSKKGDPAGNSQ